MENLSPADQCILAEPILRRFGNPSLVSSPNTIPEEMRLGSEDAVEVDGDGHVAFGGSELGRESGSESGGCGGGGGKRMVGGVGEEMEIGDETVGPFASGTDGSELVISARVVEWEY